jgi:hypothetical protein
VLKKILVLFSLLGFAAPAVAQVHTSGVWLDPQASTPLSGTKAGHWLKTTGGMPQFQRPDGTSTTMQLADGPNVLDYGAVGDGATDNTAAFQSALTAALAAGKAMLIPPGNWRCGQINDTTTSQLEIRGTAGAIIQTTASTWLKVTVPAGAGKTAGVRITGLKFTPVSGYLAMQPLIWLFGTASGGLVFFEISNLQFVAPGSRAAPAYFDCIKMSAVFEGHISNIWGTGLYGSRGIVYEANGFNSGNVHIDSISLENAAVSVVITGAGEVGAVSNLLNTVLLSNTKTVRTTVSGGGQDNAAYETVTLTSPVGVGDTVIGVSVADATVVQTNLTANNAQWVVLADAIAFGDVHPITAANTVTGFLTIGGSARRVVANGTVLGVGSYSVVLGQNTYGVQMNSPHFEQVGVGLYVAGAHQVQAYNPIIGGGIKEGVVATDSATDVKVWYPIFSLGATTQTLFHVTNQGTNSRHSLIEPNGFASGAGPANYLLDDNGTDNGLWNYYLPIYDAKVLRTVTLNPLDANANNRPKAAAAGEIVRYASDGYEYICTTYTFTPTWNKIPFSGDVPATAITGALTSGSVPVANGATSLINSSLTATPSTMLFTQTALDSAAPGAMLRLTGGAHTNVTAGTEVIDFNLNNNRIVTWQTGNFSQQRFTLLQAPTIAFNGPSTIVNSYTMAVAGPPVAGTNATLTATWALGVLSGNSLFSGDVRSDGNFVGNALDTRDASTLSLGVNNATAITLGRTADAITIAGPSTLAAGISLTGAAGTGALSFGSMTGNTSLPTGTLSWAGASGKAGSLVATAAALTLTAAATSVWSTSVGNLTLDAAAVLNLGTANATTTNLGQSAGITTIVGGSTSSFDMSGANGTMKTPSGTLTLTSPTAMFANAGGAKNLNVATSATNTAGVALTVTAGAGGASDNTAAGGNGGAFNDAGGGGGTGGAGFAGGNGGVYRGTGGGAGANSGGGGGVAGTSSLRGGSGATASGANRVGVDAGDTFLIAGIPGDGSASAAGGTSAIKLTGQGGGLDNGGGGGVGTTITSTPGIGRTGTAGGAGVAGNAGTAAGAFIVATAGNGGGGAGGSNANGGAGGSGTAHTYGTGAGGSGGAAGAGTGSGGAGGGSSGVAYTTGAGGGGGTGAGGVNGGNGGGTGAFTFVTGNGGTGGAAGSGVAGTGGVPGVISFTTGNAGAGGNVNAANIALQTGTATGSGTVGAVTIQATRGNTTVGTNGTTFTVSSHYLSGGSAPSIAIGNVTQLGTGPSAAISGNDDAGNLTITTGTLPAAFVGGAAVVAATVTFNTAFVTAKTVILVPANAAAAQTFGTIAFFVDQASGSSATFTIKAVDIAVGTLVASTAYQFWYFVMG